MGETLKERLDRILEERMGRADADPMDAAVASAIEQVRERLGTDLAAKEWVVEQYDRETFAAGLAWLNGREICVCLTLKDWHLPNPVVEVWIKPAGYIGALSLRYEPDAPLPYWDWSNVPSPDQVVRTVADHLSLEEWSKVSPEVGGIGVREAARTDDQLVRKALGLARLV